MRNRLHKSEPKLLQKFLEEYLSLLTAISPKLKNTNMESKAKLLDDQIGNTLELDKNEPLFLTTPIDGTPFNVIQREGKHFVSFGKYRITEELDTHEECIKIIEEKNWFFLLNVINATIETLADIITTKTDINNGN